MATKVNILKAKMSYKNVKCSDLAKVLNIKESTFSKKLHENNSKFSFAEVKTIKEYLKLTDKETVDIFLS